MELVKKYYRRSDMVQAVQFVGDADDFVSNLNREVFVNRDRTVSRAVAFSSNGGDTFIMTTSGAAKKIPPGYWVVLRGSDAEVMSDELFQSNFVEPPVAAAS